jgi:hypothetical protein
VRPEDRNKTIALAIGILVVFFLIGRTIMGTMNPGPSASEASGQQAEVVSVVTSPPEGEVTASPPPRDTAFVSTVTNLDPFIDPDAERTTGAATARQTAISGAIPGGWEPGTLPEVQPVVVTPSGANEARLLGIVTGESPIAVVSLGSETLFLTAGQPGHDISLLTATSTAARLKIGERVVEVQVGDTFSIQGD